MKASVATAALLSCFVCADLFGAELNPREWAWRSAVANAGGARGMVALALDGAIYDRLRSPPDDLRVVDRSGTMIPHVYRCGRTTAAGAILTRPVKIINRTYATRRFSRAVLDFEERTLKDKLKIDLAGRNYRRRVALEGGDDGTRWEKVAENHFLFDIDVPRESRRVDTLAFPENSFRYLRVTVENMPDDPERVEIYGASAFYEKPAGDPQLTSVEVVRRKIEQDEKNGATVVTLDLGFRNLPLQTLILAVDTPRFERAYSIEGRNTTTHKIYRRAEEAWRAEDVETPWSSVALGNFYRRQAREKMTEAIEATIPHAAYRYLRITIQNRDDRPLAIRDVTVKRRACALVFEARPEAGYVLYGGSDRAGPPAYDLARLAPGLDIATLPQVSHGPVEVLKPEEPRSPWSERYGYVIAAGVIVAVAIMLWMIIPVLKREMKR